MADDRTVAGTEPYAWPWHGDLDLGRLALVVAGHDEAWRGRCAGPARLSGQLSALSAELAGFGVPTIAITHGANRGPGDALGDSTMVVHAAGIDGFYGSDLDHVLRSHGRDDLVLCGWGLEGPVHSTMRSANDAGYECLLLTDSVAPLDPETADAAVSTVCMSGGIFGAVGASSDFVAAIGRAASIQREEKT